MNEPLKPKKGYVHDSIEISVNSEIKTAVAAREHINTIYINTSSCKPYSSVKFAAALGEREYRDCCVFRKTNEFNKYSNQYV